MKKIIGNYIRKGINPRKHKSNSFWCRAEMHGNNKCNEHCSQCKGSHTTTNGADQLLGAMTIKVSMDVSEIRNYVSFSLDDLNLTKKDWKEMTDESKRESIQNAVDEINPPYWMVDTFKENYERKMKKKTHGGKRKGSGRKVGRFVTTVKKEETKVMRIPISKVEETKKLIGK